MNSKLINIKIKVLFLVLVYAHALIEVAIAENRPISGKQPIIVIDAGHGGDEGGAKGIGQILEKDIALNITKDIEELFKEDPWGKILLTRNSDVKMTLQDRTNFANAKQADVFVSIHTNASEYHTASGIETYYLDNTDDVSSMRLANRENLLGIEVPSGDLNFIISDLIQTAKIGDSINLANLLHKTIIQKLGSYYEGVKDLGVKKAPFYVLVGAHMPCVLIEVSFIDHPVEGARLGDRRYQKLIANSIFSGLKSYFLGAVRSEQK